VTLTTLDQVQGTDTMKVFFRMYYDDFLTDYSSYDVKSDLRKIPHTESFPSEMAGRYFNDKVQISINNKLIPGQIVALSIQENEIFLNLVYKSFKTPKKIRIRNRILTDLYNDQINMIFLKILKNETAFRLTPDNDKDTFVF
jgi:hypothetical protein